MRKAETRISTGAVSPNQMCKYVTPSLFSRKEVLADFAHKHAQSQAYPLSNMPTVTPRVCS